jgi:AcrR family transcriptional regulator
MKSGTRARTRQAILAAAATVLARDRNATLPAIAEAAGVGRTTLHRYFPDRETLIAATVGDSVEVIGRAVVDAALDEGTPTEAMRRLVTAMVAVGERLMFLYGDPRVLEDHDSPDSVLEPQNDAVMGLIERGQREGAFDDGVSADWIQHTLWALVYAGCEGAERGRLPRHGVASTVVRTFERGILRA